MSSMRLWPVTKGGRSRLAPLMGSPGKNVGSHRRGGIFPLKHTESSHFPSEACKHPGSRWLDQPDTVFLKKKNSFIFSASTSFPCNLSTVSAFACQQTHMPHYWSHKRSPVAPSYTNQHLSGHCAGRCRNPERKKINKKWGRHLFKTSRSSEPHVRCVFVLVTARWQRGGG